MLAHITDDFQTFTVSDILSIVNVNITVRVKERSAALALSLAIAVLTNIVLHSLIPNVLSDDNHLLLT